MKQSQQEKRMTTWKNFCLDPISLQTSRRHLCELQVIYQEEHELNITTEWI